MAPISPLPPSGLPAELRQLFARGEYESLLVRTENLQKRKRVEDESTKQLIDLVRALTLIQLGRSAEAAPLLKPFPTTASKPMLNASKYAQLYIDWATNQDVETAVETASQLPGDDARRLEAQLLYRCGRYSEAAEMYHARFVAAKTLLEEKKRPVSTSRWRLMSREPAAAPVTAAELERYTASVNELATNAMAALTLAERADAAVSLHTGLQPSYETEYNNACARIQQARFTEADVGLQHADALIRADMDDDDDDVEEALAPVVVQKAYLRHLAGEVAEAKEAYVDVVAAGRADAASMAVAANNLTVALGQLAFDAQAAVRGERSLLPKEQHAALVEGLKKMRATSGKTVERKLTANQRRAMARNRAILLVQMGRMDACRTELTKLKLEFPRDAVVPLIEASLIARQTGPDTADKVLQLAGNDNAVKAARVQLAIVHGDCRRGADLLVELFPGKPAAMVTAARLLEAIGCVDDALALLKDVVNTCEAGVKSAASKLLAGMLLRVKKYQDAATVLREIVNTSSGAGDSTAIAQLVVATSYFDAREAETVAAKLVPAAASSAKSVDGVALEALPPPKRKQVAMLRNSEVGREFKVEEADMAARAAAARERKRKKRKKRLPRDYDPEGGPPDPERWLPKTLRSGYKKRKGRNNDNNFKGSQGADAAAADAAAVRNAERAAAKAAGVATDGSSVPGGRARAQRKKKNRR